MFDGQASDPPDSVRAQIQVERRWGTTRISTWSGFSAVLGAGTHTVTVQAGYSASCFGCLECRATAWLHLTVEGLRKS